MNQKGVEDFAAHKKQMLMELSKEGSPLTKAFETTHE